MNTRPCISVFAGWVGLCFAVAGCAGAAVRSQADGGDAGIPMNDADGADREGGDARVAVDARDSGDATHGEERLDAASDARTGIDMGLGVVPDAHFLADGDQDSAGPVDLGVAQDAEMSRSDAALLDAQTSDTGSGDAARFFPVDGSTPADGGLSCASMPFEWLADDESGVETRRRLDLSMNGMNIMPYAAGRTWWRRAFHFAEGNAWHVSGSAGALDVLTDAMTVDLWVWIAASPSAVNASLVEKQGIGANDGFELALVAGRVRWKVGRASVWINDVLPTERWIHIAGSYDGAAPSDPLRVFVDGHRQSLIATAGVAPTRVPTNDGDLRIGDTRFTGSIDEARVWCATLSPELILGIASDGPATP